MILRQTRHYHVISGSHAARCRTLALDLYVGGCPVGHDSSCKSPLISRCFRAGIVAVCSVHTIDQVVRCHNGHRLCIFDCDFKAFQIDLTQCTLGQNGIGAHTVILLIVACEVFDRGSAARYLLYTERHSSRHHTGKQRILGIIFKVSSAERISVDVHARCQPQCYVEQLHLMADHLADSLDQFYIPALCQKCSNRNCGTELIIGCSAFFLRFAEESAFQCRQEIARYDLSVVYLVFSLQTKTCRSVHQSNGGYIPRLLRSTRGCLRCCSRNRNSCGAKRVALCSSRITGCKECQLIHRKGFHNLSCFSRKLFRYRLVIYFLSWNLRCFELDHAHSLFFYFLLPCSLSCLNFFCIRNNLIQFLFHRADIFTRCHDCFLVQLQRAGENRCIQIISNPDTIHARLQNPGCAFLLIGSQLIQREGDGHGLGFLRSQQFCFSKACQTAELFHQSALRAGSVDLYNFFSCISIAGVGDGNSHAYFRIHHTAAAYFDVIGSDLEIGVGHTVTEGVTDWYFKGIKVTVSHEDTLFVFFFHEVAALVAVNLCTRIIIVIFCPGICHFSGWGYIAAYNISKCISAFLACLYVL